MLGVYVVMEPARCLLIPMSFAALVTGVVQSVSTPRGLLRHHWVLLKLAIIVVATVIPLMYTRAFAAMADATADPGVALPMVRNPSPVVHSSLAPRPFR